MKKSFYPWAVVALLWLVAALNYVDRQVIFTLFPLLRSQLHLSSVELGFLGTAFLWIYAVFSPIGGYLADRLNRRKVILFSIAIWSTVTLLVGLASNYKQLVTAEALLGISEAFYLPAGLALIADYHGGATRSRAIGLHQSGLYTGVFLGGWGGGWIGQHYGWHRVFFVLGVVGIIYSIFLLLTLRESPRRREGESHVHKPPVMTAVRELAGRAQFWVLTLANVLFASASWCVYSWMALFLFDRFRVSLSVAGFSSTFYIQAASFAGIFVGGWLSDKWSRTNPRARALMQAIGLLLAGPGLYIAASTGSWGLLLICLVGFGIGRGFYDCNLMPVLCQIVPEELRASGYGILNSTSTFAGGLTATAAGLLKDRVGLGHALQFASVFLLLGAACLVTLKVAKSNAPEEMELA